MKTSTREHLAWVDLLRVLACFLVILSHSCDPFVGKLDTNYIEFATGASIGRFVRASVPLFVMMSGILLLPINMDMSTFYNKRAKRLLLPFVFWSIMLPILYYFYVNSGVDIISPYILLEDYTWSRTFSKFYTFIFNFNYDTTALWYVYMLIGLYLFMPIISAWLRQASKRDVQIFLFIWLISMCLPYVQLLATSLGYDGTTLLGICDWNPYGTFYYFSGFLGYLVLSYYLVTYPFSWSWERTLSFAIPLFIIGYAITLGGFLLMQKLHPGSYPHLEIFWYFSGINVGLMAVSVFVVVQKMNVKQSPLLAKAASLTFGVYLCHFIVVQLGYDFIYPNIPLPAFVQILLIAVFTFAVSLLVVWLISLNKITRKVVM